VVSTIITNDDKNIVKLKEKIKKDDIQTTKIYIGHPCNDNEWNNWEITGWFIMHNRNYAIIKNKNTEKQFIVYKSQSGMLWHLLQRNWDRTYLKLIECGLYSTSLLLDLNLQKKLCELKFNNKVHEDFFALKGSIINKEKFNEIEAKSNTNPFENEWLYGFDKDGNKSDDSYIKTIESNTTKCALNNPYNIFQELTNKLSKKGLPGCSYDRKKYYEYDRKSKDIYTGFKNIINTNMEELFEDIGNEKHLYDCMSGKIGLIYYIRVFVKVKYSIFIRDIKSKKKNNKFKLVYSKYSFVEDKDNNIYIPDKEFIGREFITPLFITSCNNIHKNIPIYNKVASTGLYTCKAFEYIDQTIGRYDYEYNFSELKLTEEQKKLDIKNSTGNERLFNYYFIGDFMDKLWPFNK
jgi:hypothetical protein